MILFSSLLDCILKELYNVQKCVVRTRLAPALIACLVVDTVSFYYWDVLSPLIFVFFSA